MDRLQAQYVALKMRARDSVFVHVCLVSDLRRFQEALFTAQNDPTPANGKAFRDGDFMTVYPDYPLDPLQFTLVKSKDYSRDNNRLRRMLFEEFTTQFKELENGEIPAAIAIMKSDEDIADFYEIYVLDEHFYPPKAPT